MRLKKIFDERYSVSDCGKVFSNYYHNGNVKRKRGTPMQMDTYIAKNGYERICLGGSAERKHYLVHRLVLIAFVGPPPTSTHECDHVDGNRSNNRLENLRWVTAKENQKNRYNHGTDCSGIKNPAAKLSKNKMAKILKMINEGYTYKEIGNELKISTVTISHFKNAKTYKKEAREALAKWREAQWRQDE